MCELLGIRQVFLFVWIHWYFPQCKMLLLENIKQKKIYCGIWPILILAVTQGVAQATPTTYLRLLIPILPSLPHFASTTVFRALQRTWLDKWTELNINFFTYSFAELGFNQINSWSRWPHKPYLVWHSWEVVRVTILDACQRSWLLLV